MPWIEAGLSVPLLDKYLPGVCFPPLSSSSRRSERITGSVGSSALFFFFLPQRWARASAVDVIRGVICRSGTKRTDSATFSLFVYSLFACDPGTPLDHGGVDMFSTLFHRPCGSLWLHALACPTDAERTRWKHKRKTKKRQPPYVPPLLQRPWMRGVGIAIAPQPQPPPPLLAALPGPRVLLFCFYIFINRVRPM